MSLDLKAQETIAPSPVYRLIASSTCGLRDGLDDRCADLAAIITSTQRKGPEIAGVIALSKGRLHLALEGPRGEVEAAWDQIGGAFLHLKSSILWQGEASNRRLPKVPMLFVSGDPRAQRMLSQLLESPVLGDQDNEASMILEVLAQAAEHRMRPGPVAEVAPGDAEPGAPAAARPMAEDPRLPSAADAESEALDATFGVAVLSDDRICLRVNAHFAALLGYEPADLAGRPYATTLCVTDEDHLGRLWRAMRQGETVRVDRRARRRDGSEIWLRSTYKPRLAPTRQLRDVTEISIDITREKRRQLDERGQITAINRSQAIIHFDLDGIITEVNDLFLSVMGYRRDEVIGWHHRVFVPPSEADAPAYAAFWSDLARGQFQAGEYRRVAKDGRPVWLQATYNPILDMAGRPFKIVKYATDVTAAKLQRADYEWQIAAIDKSNAVLTFDMGGVILDANANFLTAFGYARDEVVGHHHRMFVEESHAYGAEYAEFWRALGKGLHQSGLYTRIDRAGRKVWLHATHNPIFDMDGRPFKVVTHATIVTDERLRQAEHQGQIAAIHRAQAVASFDLDGTILDANRRFLDILGYRLSELRGRPHAMLVGSGDLADCAFWTSLAAGQYRSGEFKHLSRNGEEIWLQATYNPIFDLEGRPFKVVQYASDVTSEKHRQAAIDVQLSAIHQSQGVLFLGLDGTILDINQTLLTILGYAREEVVGQHHSLLVEPAYAASQDYAAFWKTLSGGGFLSSRYRLAGKQGREIWLQATYNPILDLDGQPSRIVSLSTDVTKDVAMADAFHDAQQQAHYDTVTSLPNRVRLLSHMAAALDGPNGRLVVLYLDLDRFKPINDTFGHQAGDRVLGEVAERLQRALAPDQLAARLGGDEFVVVAGDLRDEDIEALCQRIIESIAEPIHDEAGNLTVGVSIGVAVAPGDGSTPDALLCAADEALYRSKQRGRGTFHFYSASMNEKALAYRTVIADIRRALDAEEFFLEFQPRFETRTQTIRSVEALIRWAHPTRGRVPPLDFIPAAEKSGLIVPMGEWTLRAACRTAARWPEIGISVNVSPIQIRAGNFVGVVAAVLADTGLAPHRLELELTEGALMEDVSQAQATLRGLKQLGVNLAMDDFGTGYSSLGLLKSFPFDVIKIDRQFVSDIVESAEGRGVIQAILALGSALGMSVTAEGIENPEQLAILRDFGCDEVQGFYLSRPLTEGAFGALLASATPRDDVDVEIKSQFLAV